MREHSISSAKNILIRDVPIDYLLKINEIKDVYKKKTGLSISQQEVLLKILDNQFKEDLFNKQFNYFYEENEKTRSEIESLKLAMQKMTKNLDLLIEILLSLN